MRSPSVREIPRPDLRRKLLDGMTTHDIPADALGDLYESRTRSSLTSKKRDAGIGAALLRVLLNQSAKASVN